MLAVENNPDQPVSQLIVSWLLMIPLFFFACRGILWFQAAGGNSFGPTGFNTLAAAKSGGEVAVFLTVFLSVLLLLITRLISLRYGLLRVVAVSNAIATVRHLHRFQHTVCLLSPLPLSSPSAYEAIRVARLDRCA
jgi:hypothetical protein